MEIIIFPLVVVIGCLRLVIAGFAESSCCHVASFLLPGSFRDTTPDTLLTKVLEAAVAESGVPMDALGDICVGNVQLGGSYAGPARMAQFVAGIPETVRIIVLLACAGRVPMTHRCNDAPLQRRIALQRLQAATAVVTTHETNAASRGGGGGGFDLQRARSSPLLVVDAKSSHVMCIYTHVYFLSPFSLSPPSRPSILQGTAVFREQAVLVWFAGRCHYCKLHQGWPDYWRYWCRC